MIKNKLLFIILMFFSELPLRAEENHKFIKHIANIKTNKSNIKILNEDEKESLEILCSKLRNNTDISAAIASISWGDKSNWPEDVQSTAFKVCIKGNYIRKNKNKESEYLAKGSLTSICIANSYGYLSKKEAEKIIYIVLKKFQYEIKADKNSKEEKLFSLIKSTINELPSCSKLFIRKKAKNKIQNKIN